MWDRHDFIKKKPYSAHSDQTEWAFCFLDLNKTEAFLWTDSRKATPWVWGAFLSTKKDTGQWEGKFEKKDIRNQIDVPCTHHVPFYYLSPFISVLPFLPIITALWVSFKIKIKQEIHVRTVGFTTTSSPLTTAFSVPLLLPIQVCKTWGRI